MASCTGMKAKAFWVQLSRAMGGAYRSGFVDLVPLADAVGRPHPSAPVRALLILEELEVDWAASLFSCSFLSICQSGSGSPGEGEPIRTSMPPSWTWASTERFSVDLRFFWMVLW